MKRLKAIITIAIIFLAFCCISLIVFGIYKVLERNYSRDLIGAIEENDMDRLSTLLEKSYSKDKKPNFYGFDIANNQPLIVAPSFSPYKFGLEKKYDVDTLKEGHYTAGYLVKKDNIKKASVFCTPSVALEYIYLDKIRKFDTDLIEMETVAFYMMAEMIEVSSIALLVISDNSANSIVLIGRTLEQQEKYNLGRYEILPKIIFDIIDMKN